MQFYCIKEQHHLYTILGVPISNYLIGESGLGLDVKHGNIVPRLYSIDRTALIAQEKYISLLINVISLMSLNKEHVLLGVALPRFSVVVVLLVLA
jgi:hypothetical protein